MQNSSNITSPNNVTHSNHPKKSIFSYNIYRTSHHQDNHQQREFLQNTSTNQFKSKSESANNNNWNEPQILFFNEKAINHRKDQKKHHRVVEVLKDTGTQTSKTIIQLAKMETGCISPDSLTTSPREKNYSTVNNYCCDNNFSLNQNLSNFSLEASCQEQDCIFYNGKGVNHSEPNNCSCAIWNDYPEEKSIHAQHLTQVFLSKSRRKNDSNIRSRSFVDYHHPNYIKETETGLNIAVNKVKMVKPFTTKVHRNSSKSLNLPLLLKNSPRCERNTQGICYQPQNTYMCATASSQIKSKMLEIQSVNYLIPPTRRGRSSSPRALPVSPTKNLLEASRKIPYIDQSKSDLSSATTILNRARNPEKLVFAPKPNVKNIDNSDNLLKVEDFRTPQLPDGEVCSNLLEKLDTTTSIENSILSALSKLRESDWRLSLRGLAEIVELSRMVDAELVYDHMININQRLLELLKSPRSHVCRTACQAAGHLFEYVKDTRRPEFDDIVDNLLAKTADANKFIRQDANLALDCMVTHISTFHAIRSLCSKGPQHKNHLVRCAAIRLLVCGVVIAGPDSILNPNNNEYTRKRVVLNMVKYLEDKNQEARKYGERLYKILCKEPRFDTYLKKYVDKDQITKMKKTLLLIHK